MSRRLTVASEVDAYCTKCKLDLGHRIIAMVGDVIKKVECLTCHSHHVYRAPRSAPQGSAGSGAVRKRVDRPAGVAAKPPQSLRSAELRRWEQAIMGRAADEFVLYAMGQAFAEGQLVRHPKFGDGVVVEVRDPGNKVSILFETGVRTLVHNKPSP
jgi:hypothetical protein